MWFDREVEEFQALVHSLGENVVDTIGKDRLSGVTVYGDDRIGTVDVEISLRSYTWDEQSRAIDKMIDIREMFMGEVALSYCFVETPDSDRPGEGSSTAEGSPLQLAFA